MSDQIWFQKYRIIKILGQGGSANVYLAEHIILKSFRAIKQISKSNPMHEQLLHEAYILKDLSHPCIPVIYDFEEDAHNSYIIEQHIAGDSLKVYRQRFDHLSEDIIINFTIQICDLLQYLYSLDNPILYLDLKPENIIISEMKIKLIDFGASCFKNQLDSRKYSMGTKGFSAPELYGSNIPDERTDIYGIGSLMVYMVAGRIYDISSLNRIRKEKGKLCSKKLFHIIEQCLRAYPLFRCPKISILKEKLLEVKSKNESLLLSSKETLNIAIAGTQSRIGATHLSLLLTSYFSRMNKKSLYIEKNNSSLLSMIIKRHPDISFKDGIYQYNNCYMIHGDYGETAELYAGYQVVISDFGCLDNNNMKDFLKADVKLMISGAKDWELEQAESSLRLLKDYQDIKYLFNFLDGSQFREVRRYMDKLSCYRIPYEPNPFEWQKGVYLDDFVERLIL